jgi:hypothetical protein
VADIQYLGVDELIWVYELCSSQGDMVGSCVRQYMHELGVATREVLPGWVNRVREYAAFGVACPNECVRARVTGLSCVDGVHKLECSGATFKRIVIL